MAYMGDVCFVKGLNKNDNDKPIFMKVGAWFETEKGLSVKLEALPLPDQNGEIWLKLFEKREDNNQPQQQNNSQPQQQNNNRNNNQQSGGYRGRY